MFGTDMTPEEEKEAREVWRESDPEWKAIMLLGYSRKPRHVTILAKAMIAGMLMAIILLYLISLTG